MYTAPLLYIPSNNILAPCVWISFVIKKITTNITAYLSNITAYRSNITTCRSNITAYRSNITACRSNITAYRSNITANRSNITANRSNITVYWSTIIGCRLILKQVMRGAIEALSKLTVTDEYSYWPTDKVISVNSSHIHKTFLHINNFHGKE